MNRFLLWLLGILAVVALVATFGLADVLFVLTRINPVALLALCLLQVITLAMSCWQWYFLIGQSHGRITFARAFGIYLAGSFVESVTPSVKIGGEATKIYLFRQNTGLSYQQLTGVLLVHKYLSLLPFLLLISLLLSYSFLFLTVPAVVYHAAVALALLLFLATAGALGLLRRSNQEASSGIFARIHRFLTTAIVHSWTLLGRKSFVHLSLVSLVVWLLYPVKVWLIVQSLGLQLNLHLVALATYTAYIVGLVPALPGSLGTFEASMALLLAQFGLTPTQALAVTLTARFVTFWFPLVFSALMTYRLAMFRPKEGEVLDSA